MKPFLKFFCIIFYVISIATVAEGSKIYTYTDNNGVIHFTNVPMDPKFRPLKLEEDFPGKNTKKALPKYQNNIDSIIKVAALSHNLDPALIRAVIHVESGGNVRAVSHKGAIGLMQLMPETAQDLSISNPFDPFSNIWGGAKYLRQMIDRFDGNMRLALAAYNAGPSTVERAGGIPAYPETINYVTNVIVQWHRYKKIKN